MNIGVQFSNMQSEDGTWTNGDTFFGTTATEGDQIFTLDANAWNLSQYDKKGVGLGWVLAPADGSASEYFEALKSAKGLIKREIGRQVKLRHIPELIFKPDTSMEYGRHISKIIDELGIENYPDREEDEEDDF